jgi:hypothetical protein
MPLTIRLEGEDGQAIEEIFDLGNVLTRSAEANEAKGGVLEMACFIDRYGDTLFNKLQLVPFIGDIDLLLAATESAGARIVLSEIRSLAWRGAHEDRLYLKFVGD